MSRASNEDKKTNSWLSSVAVQHFHPATKAWLANQYAQPTRAQTLAWPQIARGNDVLVLAPTGSGKTLSAFLSCLDRLLFASEVRDVCRVVYISPLKALATDVHHNLLRPLAGLLDTSASVGASPTPLRMALRTGDTKQRERAQFVRRPSDLLVTTPESLYLLLTSQGRTALQHVETVIIDEIHSLIPTKRGAHLMLSVARLEQLVGRPLQRIGLSATQHPIPEAIEFMQNPNAARETFVADARADKRLHLLVEDCLPPLYAGEDALHPSGGGSNVDAAQDNTTQRTSAWAAIYPKLLALIRQHRSTLLFVNNRRLAERLANALNELAKEELVFAHHGSLAHDHRQRLEAELKAGAMRALVCTSSLELGIDVGSIDLVIQIESPPSVASALQRVGRSGHRVGDVSRGVLFPKFRHDLLACAALAAAMDRGEVEATHFIREPLDVLAQQIVAMVAQLSDGETEASSCSVESLLSVVRSTGAYRQLSREKFYRVLDLLAGRYHVEALVDLRPRLLWDRSSDRLSPRAGTKLVAQTSSGTIVDRGLFAVFLVGEEGKAAGRLGELDEEMVFESRPGDTFVLGASTWRIEQITRDRVLVKPAPGEPGKMPFWRGEQAARPVAFGRRIGELARLIAGHDKPETLELLRTTHHLSSAAAEALYDYIHAQHALAPGALPHDSHLVLERMKDEVGACRIGLLSPLGGRVLAPLALAMAARLRRSRGVAPELYWTNDGIVLRIAETSAPPTRYELLPAKEELEELLVSELEHSSLLATRFREAAVRSLLMPPRRPGARMPLWQQRKKAQDLQVAVGQSRDFPVLHEAYRECLHDVFDLPSLRELLQGIELGAVTVADLELPTPSPFASALLFGFAANFLYDADAPAAERKAQALSVDPSELAQLLGRPDRPTLVDSQSLQETEQLLQRLHPELRCEHADALSDLLVRLGDLRRDELEQRLSPQASINLADALAILATQQRVNQLPIAGELRYISSEDHHRYQQALRCQVESDEHFASLSLLVERALRTHSTLSAQWIAQRWGVALKLAQAALLHLQTQGKALAFGPHSEADMAGANEFCDPEVYRSLRRVTQRRLRAAIAPQPLHVFVQHLHHWQRVHTNRRGLDTLLDVIESLQGTPLLASECESSIFPARVADYQPHMLDSLIAAGEIVWRGIETVGHDDARVAFYLADQAPVLHLQAVQSEPGTHSEKRRLLVNLLSAKGALFFHQVQQHLGGFAEENAALLWQLLFAGQVSNDSFVALRSFLASRQSNTTHARAQRRARVPAPSFRSRRATHHQSDKLIEGRWSLVEPNTASVTHQMKARTEVLLQRYSLVTREVLAHEGCEGGLSAYYEVLRHQEDVGRVQRGYFVQGTGTLQFALPAAVEQLRSHAQLENDDEATMLAACDPANPYGVCFPWPRTAAGVLSRSGGASVFFVSGRLVAYLTRGSQHLLVLDSSARRQAAVARSLGALAEQRLRQHPRGDGLEIMEIDGGPVDQHPFAQALRDAGFFVAPPTAFRRSAVYRRTQG